MMSAVLRALLVSTVLACGACAQTQMAAQPAPVIAPPATPSPRADCAQAHVTIYFAEEVASDQPLAAPLLNDLMDRVHACEAAGGALTAITIVTAADPGQNMRDARAQVQRRQDRVRAALVRLGAPTDKIVNGAPASEAGVMGRRADITADMY